MRARPGLARDHRQPRATAASADPRPAQRRIPDGDVGRGVRAHRVVDGAIAAARDGHLARPWRVHDQLRHAHQRAAARALRALARLPVLESGDDLLGPGRLRPGTHRPAGDEHQGGHGRALAADPPVGRQPGQPAEHGTVPARGEAPRRAHRHDRRAQDRGRREVGRRAADPARHRHGAGAGDAARDLRRAASRRGLRRTAHAGLSTRSRPTCRHSRPAWAAPITGIPAERIVALARRYAGYAAGDDRAGRQLDAQGSQRLAGRPRDRVPAGADRQRRDCRRRLRSAPRQRRARPRPWRHHGHRPARARDSHPQPDGGDHRRVARRAHRHAADARHQHALVVRGRDGRRRWPVTDAARRQLRPVPQ